jgi:hypothetical protein
MHEWEDPSARDWFRRRTFARPPLGRDEMSAVKAERSIRVNVCLPTLDEAATVGRICEAIGRELIEHRALVDELVAWSSRFASGAVGSALRGADVSTAADAGIGRIPIEGVDVVTRLEPIPNPDSRVRLGSDRDALGVPMVELDWQLSVQDRDSIIEVYDERARRTSGNLQRSDRQWQAILPDDDESVRRYVVTSDGSVEGYISFTQSRDGGGTMACRDLVALTPAAGRRLLTLMADHRAQIHTVRWHAGPSDPLQYLLDEQSCQATGRILWMLRIVDVRNALERRGYPTSLEAELHLDVHDDVCGWNNGRFVLEVSKGRAQVRKGGRGRLRLAVRALAPLYTGFASAAELQLTGMAEGPKRDLDTATSVFGGPAPWMTEAY